MTHELFDFLNTDLQFVKGIGPVLATRLDELLGGRRVLDFILHMPNYVKPRGISAAITDCAAGEVITIPVKIIAHKVAGNFGRGGRRAPTTVLCHDKSGGELVLQFFGSSFLDYWLARLPIGEWRIVSGKMDIQIRTGVRPRATIVHPDFIEKIEDAHKIPEFQAIYRISAGLSQRIMSNARDQIFTKLFAMQMFNPIEKKREKSEDIKEFFDALHAVHFPKSNDDLLADNENIMHLSYAELFAHQVAIALTRQKRKRGIVGRVISGDGHLRKKLYQSLSFKLTGSQNAAITTIENDMAAAEPMLRLIQGDVGSGKTIVALAAALNACECKLQTAFMAPTDTLAMQHFAKIKPMCDAMGIVCDILTGRDKGATQKQKLISIRSGRTQILIGTHALFQDAVEYKDLGLVIVDEQHRFGVNQRAALVAKGNNPDFLALSATPIPRTLSMTIYGDMDVTIINEKPVGRLAIKTTTLPAARIGSLVARLKLQIENGAKVFWVCPLVNESEDCDFAAAEVRYEYLRKILPAEKIGLVHGQMDKKMRDTAMADFANDNGKIKLLVATSVIEVGIDVPSATIMIIENAEKFGMAALHQLRGRVGRGSAQSFCMLLHGDYLTENSEKRLNVLVETDDGFVIAEQDLMMRGGGEMIGTRQSGWIPYHFVDYRGHRDLFKLATRAAVELTETDAELKSDIGQYARDLMFVFGRVVNING